MSLPFVAFRMGMDLFLVLAPFCFDDFSSDLLCVLEVNRPISIDKCATAERGR